MSTQRACLWWRKQSRQHQHHTKRRSHLLSSTIQNASLRRWLACWSCSRSASAEPYLFPWKNFKYGDGQNKQTKNYIYLEATKVKKKNPKSKRSLFLKKESGRESRLWVIDNYSKVITNCIPKYYWIMSAAILVHLKNLADTKVGKREDQLRLSLTM